MRRKELLTNGEIYHVFSRSIAKHKIFNDEKDFSRIKQTFRYYQVEAMPFQFSHFIRSNEVKEKGFKMCFDVLCQGKKAIVQLLAYCTMPTHVHLILKQLEENGISLFVGNVLNSYARYFNTRHRRKGPLWEGRFKNVRVESDDQLLHLTRYVHLNPVTAYLVDEPEKWAASSYREYISESKNNERICSYAGVLDISPREYQRFVQDGVGYQRDLACIKCLLFE